ncbi:MAG: hypothetical protein ACRCX2_34870 [Paraclostridium sp.]
MIFFKVYKAGFNYMLKQFYFKDRTVFVDTSVIFKKLIESEKSFERKGAVGNFIFVKTKLNDIITNGFRVDSELLCSFNSKDVGINLNEIADFKSRSNSANLEYTEEQMEKIYTFIHKKLMRKNILIKTDKDGVFEEVSEFWIEE